VRSRVDPNDQNSQCLYWTAGSLRWHQSSLGSSSAPASSEFEAVRRSFQSWHSVFTQCGNLTFEEGAVLDDRKVGYESKGENRNLILFRTRSCTDVVPSDAECHAEDTCANEFDCWDHGSGTIGITLTTYDERSGIIYDSDIELNEAYHQFTTPESVVVRRDVENTVTHEVGHLIGLDHTDALNSTMNPTAAPGETSKRVIDSGSSGFVCAVYPKGRPSQACLYTPGDEELGSKTGGCASAGAGAWLPALAGWALLALRRRREGGRA
jgi:hypothetical protein